ncbi:hypothetical protein LTR36_008980 [Oleoguttula mirabilis]|uniref:Uncharacterized protein n=1 Tax=Oleoguttula mirabilis TaxID=1507867 RepID=A0AAV9J6L0_9PEZI|nr:hypothetical protein LTR36_008980 [Oleoguttula mirabilis]
MDAASIEQMNKVRVSLGMAPLPVPGKGSGPQFKDKDDSDSDSDDLSTLDKRQAKADSNWQKLEDERKEKAEREKRKTAAKKARDVAQRFAVMKGVGLGDADEEEEVDTRTWLLQQKRRQKKIDKARKLEADLAEREQQQGEYGSKDLAGVKVGHEETEFDEITGEQILTLKDANIGDESEDDELENAELKAKELLEERLRLKMKKPDYDPNEQDEEKTMLSKYDEEIDGKKQKRFTLDGHGNTVEAAQKMLDVDGEVKSRGIKVNLDMLKDDVPVSDYIDPTTIKVKKPKKKKEKKTRQRAADDDDIFPAVESAPAAKQDSEAMEVDGAESGAVNGAAASKKRAFEFDDDDLQAKLAQQRRQALKKRKKMNAAELARQMREEMPVDEEEPEEGGIVMDETTEFVSNLKRPEAPGVKNAQSGSLQPGSKDEEDADADGDTAMAGQTSYAGIEDAEEKKARIKRENDTPAAGITATGLEDEDTMSGQGLGASLAMLKKRGLVHDADATLAERERKRTQFLADKKHLIDEYDAKAREQRDADRTSGRWERLSNRERDAHARQQNEAREAYLARLQADMFNRQYRPDVKLQYHDEFGREMDRKEAFKHLSHMFHGKGSGKQKTEKRLKRIEDERRENEKGVLHVGGEEGFASVQGREGKRQRQAGVRLQ